jgi:hypothetical protein
MRIALLKAGFSNVSFFRQETPAGERYVVEAVRKEGMREKVGEELHPVESSV